MKNGNGNIDPAELKKKADGLSAKAATLQSSITMLESQLAQLRQQHHQEIERSLRGEKCRADAYRSEADLVTAKIATLKGQLSQVEDERGKILRVLYAEQERQQCEAEREQLADLEAAERSAVRRAEEARFNLNRANDELADAHRKTMAFRATLNARAHLTRAEIEQSVEATRINRASHKPLPNVNADPLVDSEVVVRGQRGTVAGFIGFDHRVVVVLRTGERITVEQRELQTA